MNGKILKSLLILSFAFLNVSIVSAEGIASGEIEPLCIPNGFQTSIADCLEMGPAAYNQDMSELGITVPIKDLPSQPSIYTAQPLEFIYAKSKVDGLRVFITAEAAYAGTIPNQTLEDGQIYVSIEDWVEIGNKRVYMIEPGSWVRWDEISTGVYPSKFGGQEFFETPERNFGWAIYPAYSYRTPSYDSAQKTGYYREKYEYVQIYDTYETENGRWIMVGPDEWLHASTVGQVYVNEPKPEGIDTDHWIMVNLFEQTIAVYENNQLVYATLTATGLDQYMTRPGLFKITEKVLDTYMAGTVEEDRSDYYFLESVPWSMYFDERRALHGAYWHDGLGMKRSHGCVNLSPADSRWVYEWADVGDWVYVWDPTGVTEVDEELFHLYD